MNTTLVNPTIVDTGERFGIGGGTFMVQFETADRGARCSGWSFVDAAEAEAWITEQHEIAERIAAIPETLDRAEYEVRMTDLGRPAMTDRQIVALGIYAHSPMGKLGNVGVQVAPAVHAARYRALTTLVDTPAASPQTPETAVPFAPTGTTPIGDETPRRCTVCGAEGYHNPGAGVALCADHWESY